MNGLRAFSFAALFAFLATAAAAQTSRSTFSPQPPGTIVQSQSVALAGDATGQWRGVLSKRYLGGSGTSAGYQWYLSIYARDGGLKYRSPQAVTPFATVAKAHGAPMWFPHQEGSMTSGRLMGSGASQLVVTSTQVGADCGNVRTDVFFFDAAMHQVMTTLSVTNPCDLEATVVHGSNGDLLRVTGPYYSPTAALCCPTKPHVTVTFRFNNGKWSEQPRYFAYRQL